MPLQSANTILREAPYFDDFNEDKGFARVLFKPGVALQARELNQLQSILQNQVERFGSHVFKAGSVVSGCAEKPVRNVRYVAVARTQDDASVTFTFDEARLVGCVAVGQQFDPSTPPTQAKILAARAGFSRDGDPSKLFVQYTSGAVNAFASTSSSQERIKIYASDQLSISDVEMKVIVNAAGLEPELSYLSPQINDAPASLLATLNATDFVGVQFTNDDATWSGTLASVREDTSSISILQPDGTPSTATVTMRTLRFRQCNGFVRPDDRIVATAEGETISASVYQTEIKPWNAEEVFIGETRALEPIVFAGTTIPANGDAAGFEIGEGIIFQKGQFSKVSGQFIIVNPSSRDLSDYTVGFTSVEEVITEFVDESLYDNAFFEGGNNLNAPGAHRLKVTPKLIAVKKSEISQLPEGSEYLPLFEFNERGDITIKRTDPQYAALGNELARRTWEESGNYVVNDLFATISDVDLDKGTFKYTITPGIAYINGKRVEVLAPTEFESSMGTDLSSEQLLSTSMSSLYTRTNSGARAYDSIELYSTQNSRTVFAPGKTFTDATAVFIKQANTATVNSLLGTGTFALPATIDSSNTTHIGLVMNNVTGPSGVSAYSAPAGAANYTLPVEWVVGTTSPGSAVIGPSDTVLYFVGEDADDDGTFPVIGAAIGYVRYHGADSQVGTPLFTRRIDGTVVETSNTVSYAVTKVASTETQNVSGAIEITITSDDIGQIKGFIPRSDVVVGLGTSTVGTTTSLEITGLPAPATKLEQGDYIRLAGSTLHRVTAITGTQVLFTPPASTGSGISIDRVFRANEYRTIDETVALSSSKNYAVENASTFSKITVLGGEATVNNIEVEVVYVTKESERSIMRKTDAPGIKVRLRVDSTNRSEWRSLGVSDVYRLVSAVNVETGASVFRTGFRPGRQNKYIGHASIQFNISSLAETQTVLPWEFNVTRSGANYNFTAATTSTAEDIAAANAAVLRLQNGDVLWIRDGSTNYRKMKITAGSIDRVARTFTATVVAGTVGSDPTSITTLGGIELVHEGALIEVTFDAFLPEEGTQGPATASSYPFRISPKSGYFFRNTDSPACECWLPDTIDFRPIVEPAFDVAAVLAGAAPTPLNPPFLFTAVSGTNLAVPSPVLSRTDRVGSIAVQTNYRKFVGRKETIAINENGVVELIAGVASESRFAPRISPTKMALATVDIPPYPSAQFVTKALKPTKRYTMEDIAGLEQRIEDIEEYVALTLLEKQTVDLEIIGPDGLPRFKNGIFVDPLNDTSFMESPDLLYVQDGYAIPPMEFIEIPLEAASSGNNTLLLVTSIGQLAYSLPITGTTDLVAQLDASKAADVGSSNAPLVFYFTPGVVQRNAQNGFAGGESIPFTGTIQYGAKQGRKYSIEFSQGVTVYSTGWFETNSSALTIEGALAPNTWRVNQPINVRLKERTADVQTNYVAFASLFITTTSVATPPPPPRVIDTNPDELWPGCPYLTANNALSGLYQTTDNSGNPAFFDAYGLCSLWFEVFSDQVDLEYSQYQNQPLPWLHEFSPEGNYTIGRTGDANNIPIPVYQFPVSRCSGRASGLDIHLGLMLKRSALRRYYGSNKTSLDSLKKVSYVWLDNEAGVATANGSFANTTLSRGSSANTAVGFTFDDYSCGWIQLGKTGPRVRSSIASLWSNVTRTRSDGNQQTVGVKFEAVSPGASATDPNIGAALNQYNFGVPSVGSANFDPTNPLQRFENSSPADRIWTNQPARYEWYDRQFLYWDSAPQGANHLGNTSVRYGAMSTQASIAGVVRYIHRTLNAKKELSVYGEYTVVNPQAQELTITYPPFKNGAPVKNVVMNQVRNTTGGDGEFGCADDTLAPRPTAIRGVYGVSRLNDGDNNVVTYNGYADCGSPCGLDGDRGTNLLNAGTSTTTTYEIDLNSGNYPANTALSVSVSVPAGFDSNVQYINSRKAVVTITREGNCPEPTYTVLPGGYSIRNNQQVANIDLGFGTELNDNRVTINLCP